MAKLPIGDIGPCEVVWDYGGTELTIGPFLGEVKLKREDSVSKVHEERYGDAPVDGVFAGSVMELECPMTRSALATLEKMLPGSTLSTNALTIANKCGSDMYANAKAIAIKPIKDGTVSTTESEWVHLYKCHPYNSWEIGWARDGQRVLLVKFMVFPNMDSGYDGAFGTLGVNAT